MLAELSDFRLVVSVIFRHDACSMLVDPSPLIIRARLGTFLFENVHVEWLDIARLIRPRNVPRTEQNDLVPEYGHWRKIHGFFLIDYVLCIFVSYALFTM